METNLLIQLFQISILVSTGILATYFDTKGKIIPAWITYSLIGLGFIINTNLGNYVGILLAIILSIILYKIYQTGLIGGGDVKYMAGVAFFQPVYLGFPFPFLVLLFSGLIGLYTLLVKGKSTLRFAPYMFVSILASYTILTILSFVING